MPGAVPEASICPEANASTRISYYRKSKAGAAP